MLTTNSLRHLSTTMTADEGPQRKKRTVNSCLRCRRIKLKCDHGTPCGSCTRSGVTGECIYQDL